MEELIFTDSSLDKCLEKASEKLNISKEDLNYTIIEEKKGFFKKEVKISVSFQKQETDKINESDGKVKVLNGVITVKNPIDNGKLPRINISKLLTVNIDGKMTAGSFSISESSSIEVLFKDTEMLRDLKIQTSTDKMKAFISIKYIPHNIYKLKDTAENNVINLEPEILKQEFPPVYTMQEIKQELKNNGIVYGMIDSNIEKCIKNNDDINNLLIAQGISVIDDEDDRIELKVEAENKLNKLKEDKEGRIDFKSIGFVKSVRNNELIAEFFNGSTGTDGKDICGKVVKRKVGKKIKLKTGEGCILKDNKVISATDGKPYIKNDTISVFKQHEINGNVDLSTGNIKFVGDIIISGNVEEGMKVEAGNSIQILKNIEAAEIKAIGNITILQNAIESKITAGGEDVNNLSLINNLDTISNSIKLLYETVFEVKEHNLLGEKATDGEIVKVLLENKFKIIPKTYFKMLKDIDNNSENQLELKNLIKDKLLGLGPLSIKHYSELDNLNKLLKSNIELLKGSLALPVNVVISYCQGCEILSSGNILINGKGDYVSNLTANDSVIFDSPNSIVRGGIIQAKNEIRCKSVGSTGGVITKLAVSSTGHIWVDLAYQNTCFIVGERQYSLEKPSKEIHAYIDEKDELIIDKLLL